MKYHNATRFLAMGAALGTLAVMIYAARPWGDNYAYQGLGGYARLLLLSMWAILPYLVLFFMSKHSVHFETKAVLVLIGALLICVGGMAAYVDATWLRPDPQGGLAFLAVPFYQLIILGLLAGVQLLLKKSQVP
jgi:hypothetical protein